MKIEDIRTILIIGAGTMGSQIGFLCAAHGYDVVIYDIDQVILDKVQEQLKTLAEEFSRKNRLTLEVKAQALARISFTSNPEAGGRNADLVSESVPEDPALKGKIFAVHPHDHGCLGNFRHWP